ncbi:MAG: hypothetical protein ACI4I1_02985 [Oscillospiraceae bacterium]
MSQEKANPFVGYEYKTIVTTSEKASLYLDCYENFGWIPDTTVSSSYGFGQTTLKLKRDRKIINKMELTRLQRNFEACVKEIDALERTKTTIPSICALVVGIIGTAFMAGSVFAVTHQPPIVWLCILLAIPGFIGWIFPYFIYRHFQQIQANKVQSLIDEKYEEIYTLCEKGHSLL